MAQVKRKVKRTIETAILRNVEKLPESVKQTVLDYTEFLVNRYVEEALKTEKAVKRSGLGIWKDQKIWMSDDFDEPLEDLKDYM